jgi:hypothetical protein
MTKSQLTFEQGRFVKDNYRSMTTRQMTAALGAKRYLIEKFMFDNRLETLSTSPTRTKPSFQIEREDGLFNYNLPHDTTWLV